MRFKSRFFSLIILMLLPCCGLEEYYTISAPYNAEHVPEYNTEPLNRYFQFRTNDSDNKSQGSFTYSGTAIYYKIYTNVSTLNSHRSSIDSVNTMSNLSAAAKRMIESYKYQPLSYGKFTTNDAGKFKTDKTSSEPLVSASGSNRSVRIRLTDFSDEDKAAVLVNSTNLGIPLRSNGKSFYFYSDKFAEDQLPASSGEDDVQYDSFSTDGTWYVNAYAVAEGHDASFVPSYSLVLHLGTVCIVRSDFD